MRALPTFEQGPATFTLPPDLERYLPPSLWHRLCDGLPPRGVLLNALDRLRSLLYLLSTYLPGHLAQEKIRRPTPGMVRGQMLRGSLLFADVSGFTALSERLAALGGEGAERLTETMNRYFERMIEILAWSGGTLLKFAGDALLVYFPEQGEGEQARWAVRAGQRMLAAIDDFSAVETPVETVSLRIKIGTGTGKFLAASVGTAERMEYVVLGDTVTRTMAAEGVAEAGQLVADEATAAYLDPAHLVPVAPSGPGTGFYTVERDPAQQLGKYEIRAERRRARGAIPWSASPHATAVQMEVALRQIQALIPYLPAELVERIVAGTRQRRVESEFRPTTVLFANLTGLELLLSGWVRADEEHASTSGVRRVTRLLDEYFRAMHAVVARYGGAVTRIDPYSQGSKMLVLFGAPVAHEDDPLRAVGAALAMNRELARLNVRWRRQLARYLPPGTADPLLQQRIGITQGPTFAGQAGSATRREYTVMGDDVNLAARLMSTAQPGQVLISQRVYDAVVDRFSAKALPPVRVKGKSRPIPIYQPIGPRDDPLSRRLRVQGALVGRDAELKQGREAIRDLLQGRGGLLAIEGSAGVGKSHLADALAAHALARGVRVLFTESPSYAADAPYVSWGTLFQVVTGIGGTDSPSTRRQKLLDTLSTLGLAAESAGPLATLMGIPGIQTSAVGSRIPRPQGTSLHAPGQEAQGGDQRGPALFARLEKRVAGRQKEDRVDLWRLAQERQQAQPGQGSGRTWQNLQSRVAARQQERLFEAVHGLLERLAAECPLLLVFESAQWIDSASWELLDHLGARLHSSPVLLLAVWRSEGPASQPVDLRAGGATRLVLQPLDIEGTAALIGHLLNETAVAADLVQAVHAQSSGNPLFVQEIVRWMQRTGQDILEVPTTGLSGAPPAPQTSTLLQELVLSHLDSLPPGQRDTVRAASVAGDEFRRGAVRALLPAEEDRALDEALSGLEHARMILLLERGNHAEVPGETRAEVSDETRAEISNETRYAFRQTLVRELVYGSQSFARRRELHAAMAGYLAAHAADAGQDPDEALWRQAELLAHHYELAEQPLPAAWHLLLSGHKARRRYAYPQAAGYYDRAMAVLERLDTGFEADLQRLKAESRESQGDVALLTGDLSAAGAAYEAAHACLTSGEPTEIPARLLVKLALLLPSQDRAIEAEAYARQAWAGGEGTDRLAAAAVLAWLLWRADDAKASEWIERGQALVAQGAGREAMSGRSAPAGFGSAAVKALLADLAGDWTTAQRAYLALDQPAGAALAACRLGDRRLQQGDLDGALFLYTQAADLWDQEDDGCGLALARYRQAEALWRKEDAVAAQAALRAAQSWLETARLASEDDRQVVQRALATGRLGDWTPWRWQRYDDALRASVMVQP